MTDFLKIAKSIVVHFAHICAYSVETVNCTNWSIAHLHNKTMFILFPDHSHTYILSFIKHTQFSQQKAKLKAKGLVSTP